MISPPDCPAFGNFAANTFLDKCCSKTPFAPDLHGYLNFRKKFAILDARPQRNGLVSRYSHAMGKTARLARGFHAARWAETWTLATSKFYKIDRHVAGISHSCENSTIPSNFSFANRANRPILTIVETPLVSESG